MSRVNLKRMQAASHMGFAAFLVLCVGFLASCAGRDSRPTPFDFNAATARVSDRPLVSWVDATPDGCAVGSSGPTLNPRNAIRYSRLSAIEALAAGSLEIDIQTISGSGARGSFEVSAQALSGTLANARIVALFADTESAREGQRRIRQVYALACWPEASLGGLPRPDYPDWLIEPPADADRICATGIAGPTWKSGDQGQSALWDARLALAIALESRIEKRIYDDGHGAAKIARQIDPSAQAQERAASASELDRDWSDEAGTGPVGLPGVLYGLACIED